MGRSELIIIILKTQQVPISEIWMETKNRIKLSNAIFILTNYSNEFNTQPWVITLMYYYFCEWWYARVILLSCLFGALHTQSHRRFQWPLRHFRWNSGLPDPPAPQLDPHCQRCSVLNKRGIIFLHGLSQDSVDGMYVNVILPLSFLLLRWLMLLTKL